ncbi:MAG: hypothetical protein AVDCRST_MAG40-3336 [uncultured Gemmatimonadaceae bacterium]|uniref:Uncharacterized protein n=1 Tax=uncultured Gemmatimonadaceae bacterium TaxID=246130 RepID=A0A6J4MLN6_9BACT|nr:MAG: hypothetical protein AVDCRST_MAG40-3336 [uncultured Gemmatimonadaceae bacterium]
MRAGDELAVARVDAQVVHRHRGEAGHEALPARAAVGGDVHAEVGAGEEEVAVVGALAHHVHEVRPAVVGQAGGDPAERLAEVRRHVDVRREVVGAVAVEGHVHHGRVDARRLDAAHPGVARHAGEAPREALPAPAVVAGDPDVAVVGAGVEDPRPHRRLGQRAHRAVHLRARVVGGDAAGARDARLDLERVAGGEVGRDGEEVVAAVGALDHPVARRVHRGGGVRRDQEGRLPVEAQARERVDARLAPHGRHRARDRGRLGERGVAARDDERVLERRAPVPPAAAVDHRAQVGGDVEARDVAALALRVDDVRVGGVLRGVEAVAAAHVEPVGVGGAQPPAGARGAAPGAVVLQPAAHAIRHLHVVAHRVELPDREGGGEVVGAALVVRDRDAAVVADDEVVGVGRVDPHRVPVGVDRERAAPHRLPAVVGEAEDARHPVDPVGVLRVDAHLRVVERARVVLVLVHQRPGRAAVARAVEPRVGLVARHGAAEPDHRLAGLRRLLRAALRVRRGVGLDERVDHARVGGRGREPDAPLHHRREAAAAHLGPRLPRVGALPERRAGPAALEEVGPAHPLPARRPERVRVVGRHGDVDEAGAVADELDVPPGGAAVGGLVQPPLAVRAPDVAERGHVGRVRVGGVDHDAPDRLGLAQPHQLPRLAGVGALVHAAARGDGVARVLLAGARVDHVGVARRHRDVA